MPSPLTIIQKDVRFVPRKISHHGMHSGYDTVFGFMGLQTAHTSWLACLGRGLPRPLAWRLWQMRPQPTSREGMAAEIGAAGWAVGGGGRICHFIYGEDTYFFTPLWRRGSNRMVATYHYPPARLAERVSPGAVKSLDAVIIVGNNQREFFERLLPSDCIYFVPHHVDTEFFSPAPSRTHVEANARVICVGSLFRDFDLLEDLVRRIGIVRPGVRFDLVIPKSMHARFSLLQNAACHAGISDQQLRDLYRKADLGIMPMSDCTANNGILEMMSSGLPIIASEVGAIRDYLGQNYPYLVPPANVDVFQEEMLSLLADRPRCDLLRDANRRRAEDVLSLSATASRLEEVYRKLLGR